MLFRRVLLLLFASGGCALVYQMAWQRMFRLIFGASTLASSAVMAIFLGGLGLGGALYGRRAERSPRPLALYGRLELGVAALAALSPLLCELAGALYFAAGGSATLGRFGATLLRLVLAALAIGPAAVLMGGTLPAAARAVETDDDRTRRRVALLYAINAGGAVLGTVLATFSLFESLGTRMTLWAAAALNLGVGALARHLGARAEPAPLTTRDDESAPARPAAPPRLVYAAAAVTGFVFLTLELVWYRMLGPILGGTSFTFGLILAVALAGIGAGGWLYAASDRGAPATLARFAWTVALEALLVAVPFALGDVIAVYAAYTRGLGALGFTALALTWASVAAVVVFPAAVVAGYQFPLLLALLGEGRKNVAAELGLAYANNTFGSIAGALITGFLLLPGLGANGAWRLAMLLLAALAIAAVALAGASLLRSAATASLALAACVCALAPGPTAAWRLAAIGEIRGEGAPDRIGHRNWLHRARTDVVWDRDGVEADVALLAHDSYAFFINGKSDGSVSGDRGTQTMAGLLPALLHAEPHDALVIGLGTGMTAGWLGQIDSIERVDVAEIEPAVLEVARAAARANHDVLAQDKVHVFIGDGRELVLTAPRTYDVIVSEPSNPYRAGIASLFTEEFYRAVARKLGRGGIFAQWLQGYQIDAASVRVALRTLKRAFPYVEVWQSQESDFLFLASREPRAIDVDALRQKVARAPFRSALRRVWLVEEAEGVLARFVASNALVDEMVAGAGPRNTDDNNVLEFAFARATGRRRILGVESLLAISAMRGEDMAPVRGAVDWARVAELRPRTLLRSVKRPRLPLRDKAMADRVTAVLGGCQSAPANEVLAAWSSGGGQPRDAIEAFTLASARREKRRARPQTGARTRGRRFAVGGRVRRGGAGARAPRRARGAPAGAGGAVVAAPARAVDL